MTDMGDFWSEELEILLSDEIAVELIFRNLKEIARRAFFENDVFCQKIVGCLVRSGLFQVNFPYQLPKHCR